MKYAIVTTDKADADLRRIYEYIAFNLLVPEVAAGQLERIETAIMNLEEMPNRFRVYEEEPWHSRGLRWMPVDNFIVFYIPRDEDKTVTGIRVLYGESNTNEQLIDYDKELATTKLMNKLCDGRKSGDEKGWLLHEDVRAYFKERTNE